MELVLALVTIFVLAFVQNISFTIVSRSRNRNNMTFHLIAAFFSNTIWFLTFRELVRAEMGWELILPYIAGTMTGSTFGMSISMWIERKLGATADEGHKTTIKDLEKRLDKLEE